MWIKSRARDFIFPRFDSKQRDRGIKYLHYIRNLQLRRMHFFKLFHVQFFKRNSGFNDLAFDEVIYVHVVFSFHFNFFFCSITCSVNTVFKMSRNDKTCLQINELISLYRNLRFVDFFGETEKYHQGKKRTRLAR